MTKNRVTHTPSRHHNSYVDSHQSRQQQLNHLVNHPAQTSGQGDVWDMLIIGGGITGVGIAREAVRCKLKVLLVEQKDFAWGTSSRSSKMVHGGLRYIASGDIKTTMHSVKERERMLKEVPGLVNEMHYVMAHYKGNFPSPWMFNSLLGVYDTLAGKRYHRYYKKDEFLQQNQGIRADKFIGASQYSDAITDDSRLVMRVLDEAMGEGAHAINYLKAEGLITDEQGQVIGARLVDTAANSPVNSPATPSPTSSPTYEVRAKVVVNATGAWADDLRLQASGIAEDEFRRQIRPSRGSHLLVSHERLPINQAYTLMHPVDKRVLFIFPWENRTVIGTTDLDHPPLGEEEVGITQAELDYLLLAANDLFNTANLTAQDVISTWAGVRPLISSGGDGKRVNPSKEKRDHSVWVDNNLVTVSGGKLTTFRLIALDVIKQCRKISGLEIDFSRSQDKGDTVFSQAEPTHPKFAQLPATLQHRLQGFYGQALDKLLAEAADGELVYVADTNTIWAELRYACQYEQVVHLDDLLLRRTRLGLTLPEGAMQPPIADKIAQICQQSLGWTDDQWQAEVQRYQRIWHQYYALPTDKQCPTSEGNVP